jgi:hypothetical protein
MTHISDVQCPVTYGGVSVDNRCIIYADVTCDCMYIRVFKERNHLRCYVSTTRCLGCIE